VASPVQPLTILDDHSRFNLCLQALPNQQTATVQEMLYTIFRPYGVLFYHHRSRRLIEVPTSKTGVTYVSGTFVTLDPGPYTLQRRG
jgi:hypothetical protein